MNGDNIIFIEDELINSEGSSSCYFPPWKVLIVDDDDEVHAVTKLVLSNFQWEGSPLHFLSAYSANEAEQLFNTHNDIAVALIDVVMETDDAGLHLIKVIRNKINNKETRIILRTGQPGQAPERRIIREYDISDYKNKTELSGIKLDTLMCSSLRAYQNIVALKKNKHGLETIVKSSAILAESSTYHSLIHIAMNYLTQLLTQCTNNNAQNLSALSIVSKQNKLQLMDARGTLSTIKDIEKIADLPSNVSSIINQSLNEKRHIFVQHSLVLNMHNNTDNNILLYFEGFDSLTEQDVALLSLFATNTKAYLDNEKLRHALADGQREIVYLLGEAIERKSKETGNHIRRVAEITYVLALEMGYSVAEAEKIKSASPLHDLGKIGIPDYILHKPGELTPEEWSIMQSHVEIGYELVRHSEQDILKYSALISYQHHEKWDGSGYPNGLKGEEIDLVGRIASVADVFDALAHDRCYKKAWPMQDVLSFIEQQAGFHFDPQVIDAFRKQQNQIVAINNRYKDFY
ncbi:DUF3369 domain-containing protein [Psychromonas sp.]|nr:DUF3369 domain-containing protein [Psychromonas sp.]